MPDSSTPLSVLQRSGHHQIVLHFGHLAILRTFFINIMDLPCVNQLESKILGFLLIPTIYLYFVFDVLFLFIIDIFMYIIQDLRIYFPKWDIF